MPCAIFSCYESVIVSDRIKLKTMRDGKCSESHASDNKFGCSSVYIKIYLIGFRTEDSLIMSTERLYNAFPSRSPVSYRCRFYRFEYTMASLVQSDASKYLVTGGEVRRIILHLKG